MAGRNRTQLRAPYDTTEQQYDTLPPPHRRNGVPEYNNRYNSPRMRSPRMNDQRSHGPPRNPSRLDMLEERIGQQEKNSQTMSERPYKHKEDVMDSRLQTIMTVINRLNSDIASLEDTIRSRDSATVGTNTAVKNLEVHHVATLTDLRGRIVRCDTSLAKLSQEIRQCFESVKQVNQTQQDQQNRLLDRIHELESKIVALSGTVDRTTSEQKMKLQHLESDSGQQMAQLDSRTRQVIDDLKNNINTYQHHADVEREKFEGKLSVTLDNQAQVRDELIDKLGQKIDDTQFMMDQRMKKLEEMIMAEGDRLSEMQQHLENKVITRLDAAIRHQQDEIGKVKRDTRDGFSTVHESISNMKTVMDGKRKLLEDQLRKEISQIRKMVVLV